MSADLFAVAGAKIYLGGPVASKIPDFVESDFGGQDWVEIDGWETCGPLGDSAELIVTQLINRNRDAKQKGTKVANAMENQFAIVPTDPGQIALRAADETRLNYAVRIVFDDAPDGGTATTQYFIALIHSTGETGGGANTVRMLTSTFEPNSNIVIVPAAA